jgi:NitT/TauT family transport system permease protein
MAAALPPILLAAALVTWEIFGKDQELRWGTPSGIFSHIANWAVTGVLWRHAWATVGVALAGLGLGLVSGALAAYLCFAVPPLGASLIALMAWMNALPRILLVPLFISVLGIGLSAKLTMVVAMTIFPFFFNILNGLQNVDRRTVANAKLLGASPVSLVRHVYLPLLAGWVIAGLRTALGLAMIGAVISEYMGSVSGLGYLVDIAYGAKRYDQAVAGLVVIFLVVGALDLLVQILERRWVNGGFLRR